MDQTALRVPVLVGICLTVGILLPGRVSAQSELLPNLEPFPASDVQLVSGASGLELRFGTTSWNRGAGPLELHGGELVGPDKQNVYQSVARTNGTSSVYLVGTFEYHGGTHDHFHFENYARYSLQPVDAPGGSGREGSKVSFCLLDNVKVNTRLPNAPRKAVYVTCNPDVQGLSVGWGDRYGYALDGQSLPFGDNPSGDYLLKIEVDPNKQLHEADVTDNVSCALLRIDVSAPSVQVIGTSCSSAPAVVVDSISPSSLSLGSSTFVVITGSGFVPGMGVTFENGSGRTPTASNVNVVDGHTITATISVQNGGALSDPLWDVRVGSGVLLNGFRIVR